MAGSFRFGQAMDADVPVITIDGPGAAGKGTAARLVAGRLGFGLLDSGFLYRKAALATIDRGGDPGAAEDVLAAIADLNWDRIPDEERLRSEPVGAAASALAGLAEVRRALVEVQRRFRTAPGLVADGRDMGTVIFPDAVLKVFMVADEKVRARRRARQYPGATMDACLAALRERDAADSSRPVAPLRSAEDAVEVDSTGLAAEAVADRIVGLYLRASGRYSR